IPHAAAATRLRKRHARPRAQEMTAALRSIPHAAAAARLPKRHARPRAQEMTAALRPIPHAAVATSKAKLQMPRATSRNAQKMTAARTQIARATAVRSRSMRLARAEVLLLIPPAVLRRPGAEAQRVLRMG